MKKGLIPLVLALLLSACGFHLRGMVDVPKWLSDVAIITQNGNMELVSMLKSQLDSYNIHVNSEPESAHYWLVIKQVDYQQQIISVGASTNPRQYQLSLSISFSLQTRKGRVIMPDKTVQVMRQFTSNNNRILGSNEEERVLLSEMRQEAVNQMINRISRSNHAN